MRKPLTAKELLKHLPYKDEETIYRRCRDRVNNIPHYVDGRNIYFDLDEVTSWWQKKKKKSRGGPGRKAAFNPEEFEEATATA